MFEESTPKYVVTEECDKQIVRANEQKYFVALRTSLESPEAVRLPSPGVHDGHVYQEEPVTKPTNPKDKSRRLWWIVGLSVFGVIVVLAIVLDVVLGTRPHSGNSSSPISTIGNSSNNPVFENPPQPLKLTSLSTAIGSNANTLLLYYQSENASVVEAVYDATSLSSTANGGLRGNWSIVPVAADIPTALAAAAWTDQYFPRLARRLLVFTSDGYVAQSNHTSTFAWTGQALISNATITSRALAVCADPINMQGARVYYGSAEGYIREIIYNTNTDSWSIWWKFVGSDPYAGTACTVQNINQTNYINVYLRNSTTSQLIQKWWSFPKAPTVERDDPGEWPLNPSPYTLPTHVNISAAFDGTNTDTVMLASPNGTVNYGKAVPHGSQWLQTARTSTKNLGSASAIASWQTDQIGTVWVVQHDDGGIRAVSLDGTINATIV